MRLGLFIVMFHHYADGIKKRLAQDAANLIRKISLVTDNGLTIDLSSANICIYFLTAKLPKEKVTIFNFRLYIKHHLNVFHAKS